MRPDNNGNGNGNAAGAGGDGASESEQGVRRGLTGQHKERATRKAKAYRQYVEAYEFDDYSFEVITEFWRGKPDAPGAVEDPKRPGHWLSQRISFPDSGYSISPLAS